MSNVHFRQPRQAKDPELAPEPLEGQLQAEVEGSHPPALPHTEPEHTLQAQV